MKALQDLTNTEKARLLHDLFPEELQLFLEHLSKVCMDMEEHKDEYLRKWDNGFMPFSYWLSLANETAGILKRQDCKICRSYKRESKV